MSEFPTECVGKTYNDEAIVLLTAAGSSLGGFCAELASKLHEGTSSDSRSATSWEHQPLPSQREWYTENARFRTPLTPDAPITSRGGRARACQLRPPAKKFGRTCLGVEKGRTLG